MIKWFIIIGLIVIPFAHLKGVDQAFLKEYFSFIMALSISFYALYKNGISCINNKWALFSIGAMVISTMFVPDSGLSLGHMTSKNAYIFVDLDVNNLWNYKPIMLSLTYFLMICAIAKEKIDINEIIKVITWVGFLMSIVVIAQKLGFQQFWRVREASEIGPGARNMELTGFMAQYTLVGAFMAICFVSSLYLKEIYLSIVICIGVFLTQSHFAILSIIVSTFLRFVINRKSFFIGFGMFLIISSIIVAHFFKFNDNGRYMVWIQIIHDMTHPFHDLKMAQTQGFTGFGAGSFGIFFPIMHQSPWGKAHNEFLEFLFNNGIFGLLILLTAIGAFIKDCLQNLNNKFVKFGLISFISTCILSCGTFTWHLGWGQFYTAVIIGITYSAIEREKCALMQQEI